MTARRPNLARFLRDRRTATLAEVAAKVGVGTSTLSRWERGEAVPSAEYATLIAAAYDAPVAAIREMIDRAAPLRAA